MATYMSGIGQEGTISRPALGRIAKVGDLYDARKDRFCATSIFKQTLPPDSPALTVTDNPHSKISVTTFPTLEKKLHELDVTGAFKLSVLAGMVELGGSAKYLNKKKTSFKSVESAILYNITTKVEHLDLFNDDVMKLISPEVMCHIRATHVVVQIYWGANCTVSVTDQNSENMHKKDVEGKLALELKKWMISISNEATKGKSEEQNTDDSFSLEIFGDVLQDSSDEFPYTMEGAVAMIKKIPELTLKSNSGYGKPLTYVMIPLSSPAFQSYLDCTRHLKIPDLSNLDEGRIVKVIHLFDYMTELEQKAHDLVDELNEHHHCVARNELQLARSCEISLEAQISSARSDLRKLLETARDSNNNDSLNLEDFCTKHRTIADETFKKCEKIYETVLPRIVFAKRCTKFGVQYLEPPIEVRITSASDDFENIYVLFDGEAHRTTLKNNHSSFIELAKNSQNDDNSVCYVNWSEQNRNVRIEHYKKGKLVHADVATDFVDGSRLP